MACSSPTPTGTRRRGAARSRHGDERTGAAQIADSDEKTGAALIANSDERTRATHDVGGFLNGASWVSSESPTAVILAKNLTPIDSQIYVSHLDKRVI